MGRYFRENIAFYSQLTVCAAGITAIIFLGVKYLLPLAAPFLIAWGIAFITRPLALKINKLTKFSVRFISPLLAILILVSVLGLVSFLVFKLAGEAWQLLTGLGENSTLSGVIRRVFEEISNFFGESENAKALEEYLISAASGLVTSLLSSIGARVSSIAAAIPGVIIFIIVTVISSIYFSSDLENVNKSIKRLLPKRILAKCIDFKNNSLKIAVKYMRSYFLIMLITFSVMLLGLVILRVKYAVLMALVVALLDMLPVIGIGTVLIPWSIWCFLADNAALGIGLLILFGAAEIIRQVAEPRIVGNSLGIHPIVTLILLYGSYSLFGIFGLVLIPIFAIVIKTLIEKTKSAEIV